jgi:hypothetical protein
VNCCLNLLLQCCLPRRLHCREPETIFNFHPLWACRAGWHYRAAMGNSYAKLVRSGILFAFRQGVPKVPFDAEPPPPAPDYDDPDAWGALPGKPGPHLFPVTFNVVVVCQESTAEVAAVLTLLLSSDQARAHRSGPDGTLGNA